MQNDSRKYRQVSEEMVSGIYCVQELVCNSLLLLIVRLLYHEYDFQVRRLHQSHTELDLYFDLVVPLDHRI